MPFKLPSLVVTNGSLEFLKWLGLVAMTSDHINFIFFSRQLPFMSEFGRLAMPIFGFVLAYNLARNKEFNQDVYRRAMFRMAFFGFISIPVYILAFKPKIWFELNIMFTLLLATGIIYLFNKGEDYRKWFAYTLFCTVGLVVEYSWFGLSYCLLAWYYLRKPTELNLVLWFIAGLSLYFPNLSFWALMVIPAIYLATKFNFNVPRLKWVFYLYYPLHITVLVGIKMWLTAPN